MHSLGTRRMVTIVRRASSAETFSATRARAGRWGRMKSAAAAAAALRPCLPAACALPRHRKSSSLVPANEKRWRKSGTAREEGRRPGVFGRKGRLTKRGNPARLHQPCKNVWFAARGQVAQKIGFPIRFLRDGILTDSQRAHYLRSACESGCFAADALL